MLKAERKAKKCNFTQSEVEALVGEVEKRRAVLFGGHSVGSGHQCQKGSRVAACGRQCKCCCLRRLECGQSEKKKWSDIKVEAKKRLASHRHSVCAMGGGTGQPELTIYNWRGSSGNPSWVTWWWRWRGTPVSAQFILTWCSYSNMSAVSGTDYIWETGHCCKLRIFICLFTV